MRVRRDETTVSVTPDRTRLSFMVPPEACKTAQITLVRRLGTQDDRIVDQTSDLSPFYTQSPNPVLGPRTPQTVPCRLYSNVVGCDTRNHGVAR